MGGTHWSLRRGHVLAKFDHPPIPGYQVTYPGTSGDLSEGVRSPMERAQVTYGRYTPPPMPEAQVTYTRYTPPPMRATQVTYPWYTPPPMPITQVTYAREWCVTPRDR